MWALWANSIVDRFSLPSDFVKIKIYNMTGFTFRAWVNI